MVGSRPSMVSGHNPYDPQSLNPDAVDEKKAAEQARDRKNRAEWRDDIAWLMAQQRGRKVMLRFLRMGLWQDDTFTNHSGTLSYLQGKRSIGIALSNLIDESCLEERNLMIREDNERNRTRTNGHNLTKR